MYNSSLAPEYIFDSYNIDRDKEEGYISYDSEYFNDHFKNDAYTKHIETLAKDFLFEISELNGITIDIKAGSIYSPKYYNFATDNIDLTVTVDKRKLYKFAKENKNEFDKFLKDNYSSYDGFYSNTANSYNDWLTDFKGNNDQSIGAILTYLLATENEYNSLSERQKEFVELVYDNSYYNEFVDTTLIDSELSRITAYINDNYPNGNLSPNYIFELLDCEYLDLQAVENWIKKTVKKIESTNLKLELNN